MTARLTPATPERRAVLFAAYAAAREKAEHLGLDVQDDGIIRAAVDAAVPLAQAFALREAAGQAFGWSGVAEWLRRRADQIEAEGAEKVAADRVRRERERAEREIVVTVTREPEEVE